tara:strand:- start:287 stop:502 length:216 start_codon:yes stop_codon:yes gene_type:complete
MKKKSNGRACSLSDASSPAVRRECGKRYSKVHKPDDFKGMPGVCRFIPTNNFNARRICFNRSSNRSRMVSQ